jgi:hypothetical protein
MLLSDNLEIALLKTLEVKSHKTGQKVETILNGFNFAYNQLNDFKRVALFMQLLNYVRLFNQNRVDERD